MRYLHAREILIIHALIVDATGGRDGVRDVGLLQSVCERPKTALFGEEKFSTIFQKAAVYLDSLAKHHVFVDGNKRTSVAAALRFLELNGYRFIATNKGIENFILKVIAQRLDIEAIAKWLKTHAKKI